MAISSSTYFSNAICGVPSVAGEYVDIYAVSTTPKYPLGQKHERADGAVFRYAYFAGNCSAGACYAAVSSDTTLGYAAATSNSTPSASYQMPDEPSGVYPGSLGSRYVVLTSAASANAYAGGYFSVVKGLGSGYTYRIRSSTLSGTPTSGYIRLALYDQIQVAMDTTSAYSLVGNKYNDLILNTASTAIATAIVGVACSGVTASAAAHYGWVQTAGQVAALSDATTAVYKAGTMVSGSSTTAGAIMPMATGDTTIVGTVIAYPILGHVIAAGTASGYINIALTTIDV